MSAIRSLARLARGGDPLVAAIMADDSAKPVTGCTSIVALANEAIAAETSLAALAEARLGDALDLATLTPLLPVDGIDPARITVSGTGLTHLGSAEGRDAMHKAAAQGNATDSMRMFLMGEKDGKPAPGIPGVQPEWFYKGDGSILVGATDPLTRPWFAEDAGEEPEIAGIYLIDAAGRPCRIGFALGNEFSDHVVERENYLWLAHSKLRPASLGCEVLLGDLPDAVNGTSRVRRDGEVLWEKPFRSGPANMSHHVANLEHHHFKYAQFRQPGTLHVHYFGTATLSFADGVQTREGDVFEIEADAFALPLRNPIVHEDAEQMQAVRAL